MIETLPIRITVGFLLKACAHLAGRSTPWNTSALHIFAMRTVEGEGVFHFGLTLEQANLLLTIDPNTEIDQIEWGAQ